MLDQSLIIESFALWFSSGKSLSFIWIRIILSCLSRLSFFESPSRTAWSSSTSFRSEIEPNIFPIPSAIGAESFGFFTIFTSFCLGSIKKQQIEIRIHNTMNMKTCLGYVLNFDLTHFLKWTVYLENSLPISFQTLLSDLLEVVFLNITEVFIFQCFPSCYQNSMSVVFCPDFKIP